MKKNLVITLCATISTLLSCGGNGRLPAVDNSDVILGLANKIMEHQNAPDFVGLNQFSYVYHYVKEINESTYLKTIKSKIEKTAAYNFDLDKLVFREYYKEINPDPQIGTCLEEIYIFYDTNVGKMCRVKNVNNYKTYRYEEEMSKDEAIQYFKKAYSKFPFVCGLIGIEGATIHLLNKIPEIVEEIKESGSLDKNKGEYCNSYYGSRDEKSLQIISDIKRRYEGKWDMSFNYTGFTTAKKETRFENDFLVYFEKTDIIDIKANENNYFCNNKDFHTIEVNQNKSLINPPDISKYSPENN